VNGDPVNDVYGGLRQQVFDLDPAAIGLEPTAQLPRVWAAMMDLALTAGTATLLSVADGTTSLYTSAGGGVIGGGAHAEVVAATTAFLGVVDAHLDHIPATADTSLPVPGRVVLRAMGYHGPHAADVSEAELESGEHPLSPVFVAAHDVITELRLLSTVDQPDEE